MRDKQLLDIIKFDNLKEVIMFILIAPMKMV